MNRLLKTFLLWLLIAALPLQGMTAVVKASCGQRHHTATMGAANAAEHEHRHAHGDTHHGDGHGALSAVGHELSNAGKDSPSNNAKPAHTACSACAACYAGAVAPPSSVALTFTLATVSTAVAPYTLAFTGFIPSGPERPPKSLFS